MIKRAGLVVSLVLVALGGCASLDATTKQRQVASVLTYLFPGTEQVPPTPTAVAEIKVPFRIGVAFVPDTADPKFRLPETDRMMLAAQVSESFSKYPFIREVMPVPSIYLEPGGGFANLDRVSALLNLDVVALISFDQVQNTGANGWSFLYWTGIGAYMINGDQYDILTSVETAVFDIKSRRLLMRAGGMSTQKGSATLVGLSEQARAARSQSFGEAVTQMIAKLHDEVKAFRQRAPQDPNIKLILPPGYKP